MESVLANTAPPAVIASFSSKNIDVPAYVLSLTMVTAGPFAAIFYVYCD